MNTHSGDYDHSSEQTRIREIYCEHYNNIITAERYHIIDTYMSDCASYIFTQNVNLIMLM